MFARKVESLLKNVPPLERFVKRQYRKRQFRTELQLIAGKHKNPSTQPSIIHFSFNKAATQYVKSVLRKCVLANRMVHVGIHEYAFHADFPYLDHLSAREMEEFHYLFKKQGYLYSAFGGMIEGIPDLEDYKVVLVVRDPRDILVSAYYSIAYSHGAPDKTGNKYAEFMDMRTKARESTIDDFVTWYSDTEHKIFRRYEELLLEKYSHAHFATYEEMVLDFPSWLDRLLEYCELKLTPDIRKSIIEENEQLRPSKENVQKHIRKGQPGDYRNKLKPETIAMLNEKYASVLKSFGYAQTEQKETACASR